MKIEVFKNGRRLAIDSKGLTKDEKLKLSKWKDLDAPQRARVPARPRLFDTVYKVGVKCRKYFRG